jgi:uncharacterized protein (DUF2062 family)
VPICTVFSFSNFANPVDCSCTVDVLTLSAYALDVLLPCLCASVSIASIVLYVMWGCYRQIVDRRSRKRIDREVTSERREQLRRGIAHHVDGM